MPSIEDLPAPTVRRPGRATAKVPHVAALFWIVKIVTTAMGEALADYLAAVSIALAAAVGVIGLALTLWLQFRRRSYDPATYWSTVAMVAVFGTMVSDGAHIVLHIPYAVSTAVGVVSVAVILTAWYVSERTLSIHSIVTRRREVFYWLTVLATFALGTAAGDFTAGTLHLGFLRSALLFTAAILVPLVAWRWFGLNAVVAFWTAYIITRPVGASYADWLGKSHHLSGLGLGDDVVAVVLLAVLAVLVGYLALSGADRPHRSDAVDAPDASE